MTIEFLLRFLLKVTEHNAVHNNRKEDVHRIQLIDNDFVFAYKRNANMQSPPEKRQKKKKQQEEDSNGLGNTWSSLRRK